MDRTSWLTHGGLGVLIVACAKWVIHHVKEVKMKLNGNVIQYKKDKSE
jgi:hypothetical protein